MSSDPAHIARLDRLIETLRGENGCPWDRKQTPRSLAVYLTEEVFELADAIASGDPDAVCEELGDVLFQVLFIARMFQETGQFGIEDAARRVHEKMVRRHPHVFGDDRIEDADQVRRQWHEIKKTENPPSKTGSVLDSVPAGLPALMRAYRISERAARSGFDWDDIRGVADKVEEEWGEFNREIADDGPDARLRATLEFGDLLFALVNVARFAGFHPETALSEAVGKFERRFRHMERVVAESGREMESVTMAELGRLWESAKSRTQT